MLTRRHFGTLAVTALATSIGGSPVFGATQQEAAVALTEKLLSEAHDALRSGDKRDALREAVSRAFAFDLWGEFLIQSRADAFSNDDRNRFGTMLPAFLAHLYHEQFDRGLDQAPTVGAARKVRRDVLVASEFLRANGRTLPVEWRIRDFPERGPKVIDIMVGGTSFLLLKRDEFTAIIDKGGVPALFEFLERNTL